MADDRLILALTVQHATEDFKDDRSYVYFEQASKGVGYGDITVTQGTTSFHLSFVDDKTLDELATFFAHAAQKLRYCSK